MARLPGLSQLHPMQSGETTQGALALLYELQRMLAEITGLDEVSLAPAAGAHGELAGILIARAYHQANGGGERRRVLVPDSAHGTNPATAAMAGFEVQSIPSDAAGNMDLADLERALGDDGDGVAARFAGRARGTARGRALVSRNAVPELASLARSSSNVGPVALTTTLARKV